MLRAEEALWHPMRPIRETYIHADHQCAGAAARAALGEAAFAAAWGEGRAMIRPPSGHPEQAMCVALEEVAAG